MNLKFWQQNAKEEKERLLRWRETMLEATYNIRVATKVSDRYFAKAKDGAKVKRTLWGMVADVETGKLWKAIYEVEEILRNKYDVEFLDAGHLEDLRLGLLTTNIQRAELFDDRNLPTVQPGRVEADQAPCNSPC